jgi:hypothetical protein
MKRYFIKPDGSAKFSCAVPDNATQEQIDSVADTAGYVEVSAEEYKQFRVKR